MFNNLIESKPRRDRSVGGFAFSVIMHSALAVAVVAVTLNAGQKLKEKPKQEEVKFIDIKPKPAPPPEPEKPPPPQAIAAPPPPKGFQVLQAPIKIPDKIPDIDLSKEVTNENDFSGKGVAGGKANGTGTTPVNTDQTYFSFQVEKQTLAKEGNPPPQYPSMLQSSGVTGEVLAQFVVDTTGRAEMSTFKVLKASNDLFTSAVKKVLPEWKFYPAETGGRKVKQLVQLPFVFNIPK